jgi:hypothetical protein
MKACSCQVYMYKEFTSVSTKVLRHFIVEGLHDQICIILYSENKGYSLPTMNQ